MKFNRHTLHHLRIEMGLLATAETVLEVRGKSAPNPSSWCQSETRAKADSSNADWQLHRSRAAPLNALTKGLNR